MSAAYHLPDGAADTAFAQGWSDESLVALLCGFISQRDLDYELSVFLAEQAEDENASSPF